MNNKLNKHKQGISLVEVLISIALILVFIVGVSQLANIGLQGGKEGDLSIQASLLAQEGIEAMYAIRDSGGFIFLPSPGSDSFITSVNEYYQPIFSGGIWQLGSKRNTQPPAVLSAPYQKFTRIAFKRLSDLNPCSVVLHFNGVFFRVGENLAVNCDDSDTRADPMG